MAKPFAQVWDLDTGQYVGFFVTETLAKAWVKRSKRNLEINNQRPTKEAKAARLARAKKVEK